MRHVDNNAPRLVVWPAESETDVRRTMALLKMPAESSGVRAAMAGGLGPARPPGRGSHGRFLFVRRWLVDTCFPGNGHGMSGTRSGGFWDYRGGRSASRYPRMSMPVVRRPQGRACDVVDFRPRFGSDGRGDLLMLRDRAPRSFLGCLIASGKWGIADRSSV